jgi:hypothetical protein
VIESGSYRAITDHERNLLELQFDELNPSVADIPQGAGYMGILPEEISALEIYLAIGLIWRRLCHNASA